MYGLTRLYLEEENLALVVAFDINSEAKWCGGNVEVSIITYKLV